MSTEPRGLDETTSYRSIVFQLSVDILLMLDGETGVELLPDTYLRRPAPATELMGVGMLAA
jgi:hypothetical protein